MRFLRLQFNRWITAFICLLFIGSESIFYSGTEMGGYDGDSGLLNRPFSHPPVTILSDQEFENLSKTGDISGSGSVGDPYVIENLTIDGMGNQSCILICNTTSFFIIRNCTLINATPDDIDDGGIRLVNVTNGTLADCYCYGNYRGISIAESTDVEIIGCDIGENEYGISIGLSNEISISGNRITSNGMCGLCFNYSDNNRVFDKNFISYNGYGIYLAYGNINIIESNLFFSNTGYAILNNGHYNRIFNNSFVENNDPDDDLSPGSRQAITEGGSNNIWYSAESSIGNYWSDWTTPDNDSDGIVDDPYIISDWLGESDEYPRIVSPFVLLSPPIELNAVVADDDIELTWREPLVTWYHPVLRYNIFKMKVRARYGEIVDYGERKIGTVSSNTYSFIDPNVVERYLYNYWLSAETDIDESCRSDIAIASLDNSQPIIDFIKSDNEYNTNKSFFNVMWRSWDEETGLYVLKYNFDGGDWVDVKIEDERSIYYCFLDNLNHGNYSFSVKAVDLNGNTRIDSINIVVDFEKPRLVIISPKSDVIYNESSIILELEGSDVQSGIHHYSIVIDNDGQVNIGNVKRFEITGLKSGSHILEVYVYDHAGNWEYGSVEFIVDISPPKLYFISPRWNEYVTNRSLRIKWHVEDDISGVESVELRLDGKGWIDVGGIDSYLAEHLDEGDHYIEIKACDKVGNSFFREMDFKVDAEPPMLTLTMPKDLCYMNTSIVRIEWEGSDNISGISHYEIILDNESIEIEKDQCRFVINRIEDGLHKLTLIVYDGVDKSTDQSISFTVDTVRPHLEDRYPPSNERGIPVDLDIQMVFSEIMMPDSVHISIDGVQGQTIVNGSDMIFSPLSNLSYNTEYTITFCGSDLAGNWLFLSPWTFRTTDIGYLKGRLMDEVGVPIPFGMILIDGHRENITNENGNFSMELHEGSYNVTIKKSGYMTWSQYTNVTAGEVTDLRVILEIDDTVINGDLDDIKGSLIIAIISIVSLLLLALLGSVVFFKRRRKRYHYIVDLNKVAIISREIKREIDLQNTDCYRMLGVRAKASPDEIKRAYRKLAALYHPDKLGSSEIIPNMGLGQSMIMLNRAKEILLDPEKRKVHDMLIGDVNDGLYIRIKNLIKLK